MNRANVKLIFRREVRDQLRDRRTLFMIVVLPILLYPLLGMSLFQVIQFVQQQSTRVLVVGAHDLDTLPPLFENRQFASSLFRSGDASGLLELVFATEEPLATRKGVPDPRTAAQIQVQGGKFEAALYFPADFAARLAAFRQSIDRRTRNDATRVEGTEETAVPAVPSPEIIYTTANEKSQIAYARLSAVLHRWMEQIGDENLAASGISARAVRPFLLKNADVADRTSHRGAAMWSKILPMLMLLWALTGAFYPAVDLCAGEKERGTLETLLSSPAQRSEIVVAKLLTIMLFSIATAALNLLSVGVTACVILTHLEGFALPPPTAMIALAIALVPIAALFSAVCLALAAFARSTREGQYYLMPVLIVTMPLVVLPMSPGVELNFGNSLIPVTGVVLLLRSVLEGDYWRAVQFLPTVVAITLVACLMSIRWAVEQFNSESVLFNESERLDLRLWLRHLFRDRQPTPSVAAAVCCGVIILIARFFLSFSLDPWSGLGGFARMVLTTQLAIVAAPAVLMTLLLTRSAKQTLLLKWPPWLTVPAAVLLAAALHPAANVLQSAVTQLYPVSDSLRPALENLQEMLRSANLGTLILVIAVLPAVCEELAFRGFILSGFRHLGHKWRAIVYSALFFGLVHGILQQSLIACLVGVIIAYLAVQSGSLLPGVLFHVTHNSLALLNSRIAPEVISGSSVLRALATPGDDGGCIFVWPVVAVSLLFAVLLLGCFALLPYAKSPEEVLEETIARAEKEKASLCSAPNTA